MDGKSHKWVTPEARAGGEPMLTGRSVGVTLLSVFLKFVTPELSDAVWEDGVRTEHCAWLLRCGKGSPAFTGKSPGLTNKYPATQGMTCTH